MARKGGHRAVLAAGLVAAAVAIVLLLLGAPGGPPPRDVGAPPPAKAQPGREAHPGGSTSGGVGGASFDASISAPSPAAGWEEAAEAVSADLQRILDGRPRSGAYAEARAEAARADLALFPPDRSRLRRLLAGSERERILALAALAAGAPVEDDLARLVLRSQRPGDADVARLLVAELAAGLPPEVLARNEDDLLRAFEREPNPLVIAVALPALERMDASRLRALLRAQAAAADPEMLPVLLALARGRLGKLVPDELAGQAVADGDR